MIRAALTVTLPLSALGAVLMALGCRGKDSGLQRARWFKFLSFFLIVHGVVGAAWAGRTALTVLAGAIVLAGCWELARARRRMASPSGWLWIPALTLFAAFVARCWTLAPPQTLYVFLGAAVFDGLSQVTGQLLGKRPLAPTLSPAKTLEGFAGGMTGAVLAAVVLRGFVDLGPGAAALRGVGIGLAALAGDLAGSWTQRRAGIKDFSGLLPGQGGVLDRFNSFIAAAVLAGTSL
jgi:phosphatidate cytidylyltransferase